MKKSVDRGVQAMLLYRYKMDPGNKVLRASDEYLIHKFIALDTKFLVNMMSINHFSDAGFHSKHTGTLFSHARN